MKTSVMLAALLCAVMLASCGAGPAEKSGDLPAASDRPAITVTDDLGRVLTLEESPRRVAVLIGSFAETWLLAGGDLIAAPKDAWEDFDLSLAEDVVDLGSYQKISVEALFDLEPDLIIASANTKSQVEMKDTLSRAGVNVLYFDVNGFDDYLRMLETCAEITGRRDLYEANGLQVQQQVEQAKASAAAAAAEKGVPRILLVRTAASGIHAKGSEGTVLGLMLRDLGCVNIADGSELLDNLSLEKIIEEDPDRIFIVMQGSDTAGAQQTLEENLLSNPAWAGLTAVKEGRVHYMDKQLYHLKPNNRWGIAYAELEKLLYEE